ncbi:MAG: V-type ATP synthase subunit E [Candidatus Brocadiaceae bacterium]|nr:V-type ATP synthase subunit E [Candidatus Brocadiaceae bacterium]
MQETQKSLLDDMEREVLQEKERLEAATKKQIEDIKAASEKEVKRLREELLKSVDEKLKLECSRSLARAEQEVKNSILLKKQGIIEGLLKEVEEAVLKVREEQFYPVLFKQMLLEALKELEGEVIINVHPSDKALCQEIIRELGRNCMIEDVKGISGGVILISPDGRVTIHNSLQSRIENARKRAMEEVSGVLFRETTPA